MARSRLLKPDFFEDEKLTALPFGARILFEAYWCLADREGRIEDRPSRVAAFAFPPMGNEKLQAQARREVIRWRNLLIDSGMLRRYEVDGEPFLLLVNWEKHQKIHPNEPKSSLPPPLATIGNQSNPKATNVAGSRSGKEAEAEADSETREPDVDVPSEHMRQGRAVHVDDPVDQIAADFAAFGKSTAGTARAIEDAVEDYGIEWVKLAVRYAGGAGFEGQPPWSYVEQQLKRWKKQGHPDEVEDERKAMGRNGGAAQAPVDTATAIRLAYPGIKTWDEPDAGAGDGGLAPVDGGDDSSRLEVRR